MNQRVFLTGSVRTPLGKFGGALKDFTAADLGEIAGRANIERSGVDPASVDELVAANARQAGTGPNLGRQLVQRTDLPLSVPAYTVNMACGSGMKAVQLASETIRAGNANCVMVIGVEAMSRIPYLLEDARWGYKLGNSTLHDALYRDGFICALSDQHMGMTAESLADEYGIERAESDRYALESHRRAVGAQERGAFDSRTTPITLRTRRGESQLGEDECPRRDTSLQKIARLPPVFKEGGQVTAGNASAIADGAAALLVVSERYATERGIEGAAEVLDFAQAGVQPERMGVGPVPAIAGLMERLGTDLEDFSSIELNEAFAVQVLACLKELDLPPQRVNPEGGAIALGHPIGMTGVRMLVALDHRLEPNQLGLASMCVNGGMGVATALKSHRGKV